MSPALEPQMFATITSCRSDILDLRTLAYSTRAYDVPSIRTMADEFDDRSEHVCIWSASLPLAAARLTPGPRSVFETWSQGKAAIPTGSSVVDISRVAVRPEVRRLGLSTIVLLESLCRASERGFQFIVGATTPKGALAELLGRLGFDEAGGVVELVESQGQRVSVQPMVLAPTERVVRAWRDLLAQHRGRVVSGLPPAR